MAAEPSAKGAGGGSACRRTNVISLALLGSLLVAAWWTDAWLWARLRVIANESQAAHPAHRSIPFLMVDAKEELEHYSPRRLANFLDSSSRRIRTVVCLALGDPRQRTGPQDWDGVFLKLLEAYRKGEEFVPLTDCVWAMRSVPSLTKEEAEAVFGFAAEMIEQPDHVPTMMGELLERIGASVAAARPKAAELLSRSLERCDARHRISTMEQLVRAAPNSKEARDAVRRMAPTLSNHQMNGSSALELLRSQPELIDEQLEGDEKERLFAVRFAAYDVNGPPGAPRKEGPLPAWVTSHRFNRIGEAAKELAAKMEIRQENGYWDVFSVVGRQNDGPEWLFDLARRSAGARRSAALASATAEVRQRERKQIDAFYQTHLNELLGFLLDPEQVVRNSTISNLYFDSEKEGWLRRQRIGADSPIIAAVRRLVDKHPTDYAYTPLQFFADATPDVDPRDVARVAVLLEHMLNAEKAEYERAPTKSPRLLFDRHQEMSTRLEKHADHPAARRVLELRKKLEAQGVLETKKEQPSTAKIDE